MKSSANIYRLVGSKSLDQYGFQMANALLPVIEVSFLILGLDGCANRSVIVLGFVDGARRGESDECSAQQHVPTRAVQ